VSHALPVALDHRRLPLRLPAAARRSAAVASLLGLLVSGLLLAAGAAHAPSSFVPGRKGGFPAWLHGPLEGLQIGLAAQGFVALFAAMWVFYFLALLLCDSLPARGALAAVVALHAVFLLGPPLLSTDVFNYVEYGRLGALHGLNPYTHSPSAVPADAAFPFIGWRDATSVYGPGFTLGTYATAPLGVGGALWAMKALSALGSLACVALVWKGAELLGRRPLEAALFFGLNPLVLVYAVGGAHNDMLMMALAVAGIVYVLAGREASGGLAAAGALAVKASAGILLPFLVLGSRTGRRAKAVAGVLAAVFAAAAIWVLAFDAQVVPFLETLRWEQHHGSLHSVPKALGSLVGIPIADHWLRLGAGALLAAALVFCLWRSRHGRDWLVSAGWATFALLVTTAWLLPWYVVWLLPISAMTGNRGLRIATFAMSAFVIGMRLPLWLG
jgi:glycosyl transferase family 87